MSTITTDHALALSHSNANCQKPATGQMFKVLIPFTALSGQRIERDTVLHIIDTDRDAVVSARFLDRRNDDEPTVCTFYLRTLWHDCTLVSSRFWGTR